MKINKISLSAISAAVLLFSACKKDKTPDISFEAETVGIYTLCEGSMGNNNAEITYYDIRTGTTEINYYKKVNGTDLGESANDLQQYGSKIYCVITGAQGTAQSFIDILDINTAKSIKRIAVEKEGEGYLPRNVAFYKNKAYISCLNGKVLRLDTATYAFDELEVGEGLEQLAVAANKLYVTHSNHFMHPNGKKKVVSVIDLNTFKETKEIEVPINPTRISAAANGDLFVLTMGSFNNDAAVAKISSSTDTKTAEYTYYGGQAVDVLAIHQSTAYAIGFDDNYTSYLKKFNITNGEMGSNFITDATTINPYGLAINILNNEVLVTDNNNYGTEGKAVYFTADGKKKFEFTTAAFPKTAVFKYGIK